MRVSTCGGITFLYHVCPTVREQSLSPVITCKTGIAIVLCSMITTCLGFWVKMVAYLQFWMCVCVSYAKCYPWRTLSCNDDHCTFINIPLTTGHFFYFWLIIFGCNVRSARYHINLPCSLLNLVWDVLQKCVPVADIIVNVHYMYWGWLNDTGIKNITMLVHMI